MDLSEPIENAIQLLFTNYYLRVSLDPKQIPGWRELSKLNVSKEWDGKLVPYGTTLRFNQVYTFGTPIHLIYLNASKDMPGRHSDEGVLCSRSEFDGYIERVEQTLIQMAYFVELCKTVPFFGHYVPQLVDFGIEGDQFKFVIRKTAAPQPLLGEPGVLNQIKAQLPRLYATVHIGRSSMLQVQTLGRDLPSFLIRRAMPDKAKIGPMRRSHLWSWWK